MATEKRLIDANGSYTLNANDNTEHSLCFGGGIISVMDERGDCICEFDAEDAPTVDAMEVVHGEWLTDRRLVEAEFTCSECGYSYIDADAYVRAEFKYCPNCGAKMDGDGNG